MKTRPVLLAAALLLAATSPFAADSNGNKAAVPSKGEVSTAPAGGQVHTVVGGDTLWGLSGQYLSNPSDWPRLWSYNPHIRNPHWIYPGEKVNLVKPPSEPMAGPLEREVRLVVEKVSPKSGGEGDAGAAKEPAKAVAEEGAQTKGAGGATDGSQGEKSASSTHATPTTGLTVALNSSDLQDFVAAERPLRLGTIDNSNIGRNFAGEGEEVRIAPRKGVSLKEGERLTLFDDSREIKHPVTGKPVGHHVRVVGELKVISVGSEAILARVLKARDPVEDGQGVIAERIVSKEVREEKSSKALDGAILGGRKDIQMFAQGDVIFLDKGGDDGVVPGIYVDVPVQKSSVSLRGFTEDQEKPLAHALVVAVEPRSSTALIVKSRWGVEAGMRFSAAADSP